MLHGILGCCLSCAHKYWLSTSHGIPALNDDEIENFHLEPRNIGKGYKRCVFALVKKVLQILFFLSPYKVHVFSSHTCTCNLASMKAVIIKLKLESCSCRILLRKINFRYALNNIIKAVGL